MLRGKLSLAALAVVVAGVMVSGCGDDGPSKEEIAKDRRQVAFVISQSFLAKSPKNECATYTRALAQEVFGGLRACMSVARPSALEPRRVNVGALKVDGDEARAFVALRGNGQGDVRGRVWLRRDGEWHIERLGVDLLRGLVVSTLRQPPYTDEEATSSKETRRCAGLMLEGMPDKQVRSIAYNAIRPIQDAGTLFNTAVVRPCLVRDRAGREYLRRDFEAGVAEGLRAQGLDPKERRCVRQRLRKTLRSRVIAEEEIKPESAELDPAIPQEIDRAEEACG